MTRSQNTVSKISAEEFVKEKFKKFLANSKKGVIREVEQETDTSRQHLYFWRIGKTRLSQVKLNSITQFLIRRGAMLPGEISLSDNDLVSIPTRPVDIPDIEKSYQLLRVIHRTVCNQKTQEKLLGKLLSMLNEFEHLEEHIDKVNAMCLEIQNELAEASRNE